MSEQPDKPALTQRRPQRNWVRRIIMPLLILVFAGALLYYGRVQEARHEDEVGAAVRQLLDEIAASAADRLTPGHVAQRLNVSAGTLEQLAPVIQAHPPRLRSLDVHIKSGDAQPPFGDGTATHRAYIVVHGTAEIALRVHHPGDAERIVILGYWTP